MKSTKSISAILLAAAVTVFFSFSSCEQPAEKTTETEQTEMDDDDMDEDEDPITEFREALAMLPVKDRVETFKGMSLEFKAKLWRSRLTEAMEGDITEDQKGVLMSLVEYVSPELYKEGGNEKLSTFLKEYMPTITKAFGEDNTMFADIVNKIHEEQADIEYPKERTDASDDEEKDCECSTKSDWCAINFDCEAKDCDESWVGCGTMWAYSCDGLCIWQR